MRFGYARGLALLSIFVAACGDGGSGGPTQPNPKDLQIAVQGGDQQVWSPGATLPKPLQVVVKNAASKNPVKGVTVVWQVTQGTGAALTPPSSVTDSSGIASTRLTLGPDQGTYTVTANFSGNIGPAATFTAEAATGATITGIAPTSARSGDTVTVSGSGFSSTPQNNIVLFDGVRGAVVSATATQLRVIVPLCLPTKSVQVVVMLGAVSSVPVSLAVTGTAGSTISLAVGQAAMLSDPAAINCARVPAGSYLVVVEDATDVSGTNVPAMDFQLLGVGSGGITTGFQPPVATVMAALKPVDVATAFESRLRRAEAQLVANARASGVSLRASVSSALAGVPNVGDSASFNVLTDINGSATKVVKAVVKAVTNKAIVYQDVTAPAGGFATADFQQFGQTFDDPIYDTDTSVYGAVSDIDNNQHVIILFTPAVNGMSPKGATSFVAGFFYGCDLLPPAGCAKTNRAEIFYAAVPDPNGSIGPTLSKTRIQQTTPPVLAHEFMHMIHFNQRVLLRNAPDESLWLSEALAHTAEDTVGGVFLQRGDTASAVNFMGENWARANDYLDATPSTSLLAYVEPGTLAERGAGWLFIKYLRSRFGGSILGKLTQTSLSSTVDVSTQTGLGWNVLLNDWLIALWADDAPELAGVAIDPKFTYTNINLRRTLGQNAFGGYYHLKPTVEPFTGFSYNGTVVPATGQFFTVAGTGTAPLALSLAAPTGAPFAGGVVPQLGILRYK